jgi:hypothetical protein
MSLAQAKHAATTPSMSPAQARALLYSLSLAFALGGSVARVQAQPICLEATRTLLAVGRGADFDFDISSSPGPWRVLVTDASAPAQTLYPAPVETTLLPIKELGNHWGSDFYATGLAFGNVDDDIFDELVVTRFTDHGGRIIVYDDGARAFNTIEEMGANWDEDHYATSVALGDIDLDGKDDLFVGRKAASGARALLIGRPSSSTPFETIQEFGGNWDDDYYSKAVAVGANDASSGCDPFLGIARYAEGGDRILVYRAHPTLYTGLPLSFETASAIGSSWDSDKYGTGIAFGNVDGSGCNDDMAFTRTTDSGARMEVLTQDSRLSGALTTVFGVGDGWDEDAYASSVAFGDIDGDGLDEVAVTRVADSGDRVFLFDDALAGFATLRTWGSGWGGESQATSVTFGDIDADGREELAFTRRSNGNERIFVVDDATTGFADIAAWGGHWIAASDAISATAVAISQPRTSAFADSDGDGLLNLWETNGIDTDCDGSPVPDVDLPAWGANPNHKDIFVEADWVPASRMPSQALIRTVKAAFSAAPIDAGGVSNPDGLPGIHLWVDTGGMAFDPVGIEGGAPCTDGIDNDGDMRADGDDPDCGAFGLEDVGPCNDNMDNDGDKKVDTFDEECIAPTGMPMAPMPACLTANPALLIEGAGRCNDGATTTAIL